MTVFVDTSALYALLDEDDHNHSGAGAAWPGLVTDDSLLSHSYVVVETTALVQRRLGREAATRLHDHLLPVIRVVFVDEGTHRTAVEHWRGLPSGVSLVDATSFVVMRELAVERAFAFDPDFTSAGFGLVE